MSTDIVLASASPRRRDILNMIGLPFRVEVSGAEETMEENMTPEFFVEQVSLRKAAEVAQRQKKNALIIAADTVVVLDEDILTKPKDEQDAMQMLGRLSGREHEVLTGLSVIRMHDGKAVSVCEKTKVHFRKLSEEEIDRYVQTGEPMDKAGSYGLQGRASVMADRIDGDFFNVIGLPVCRLAQVLNDEFDFNIMLEVF